MGFFNRLLNRADRLRTFTLNRLGTSDQGTFGRITHKGEVVCFTMELPDRDNATNISRIPAGKYKVIYIPEDAEDRKYTDCYQLMDVECRTAILIHKGNWAGDIEKGFVTNSCGCILPAAKIGRLCGQLAGRASGSGLEQLHEATGRNDFMLVILDSKG